MWKLKVSQFALTLAFEKLLFAHPEVLRQTGHQFYARDFVCSAILV